MLVNWYHSMGRRQIKKTFIYELEPEGAAIVWGYKEKYTDENYTAQFIYAAKDYGQYEAGNFYMHGNLDLRGRELKNCNRSIC